MGAFRYRVSTKFTRAEKSTAGSTHQNSLAFGRPVFGSRGVCSQVRWRMALQRSVPSSRYMMARDTTNSHAMPAIINSQ